MVFQIRQLLTSMVFVDLNELRNIQNIFEDPLMYLAKNRQQQQVVAQQQSLIVRSVPSESTVSLLDASNIIKHLKQQWKLIQGRPSETLRLPFSIPRRQQQPTLDQDAVTIAVHADTTKLNRLLLLIRQWQGPVSASIYIQSHEDIERLVKFVVMEYPDELVWVDFHLVMEENDKNGETSRGYPHNILRNMALRCIESDYFLAVDVDFVTPPNAYQGIQELIRTDAHVRDVLHNRTFLVLPAFDRIFQNHHHQYVDEDQILNLGPGILPRNKNEAIEMWNNGQLEPFHLDKFQWGHGPTEFSKWQRQDEEEQQQQFNSSIYPIMYDFGFEPYVMGYLDPNLPKYWEGFRGFGFNKYTWFVEAHYMGWNFAVIRPFFVVHLQHAYATREVPKGNKLELRRFKEYLLDRGYPMTDEEYDDI